MKIKTVMIALAIISGAPVWAINKCTIDGQVVFQDAACPGNGETLNVRPASGHSNASTSESAARTKMEIATVEWRSKVNAAIASGEPLVGMTRMELDKAMGAPTKVNANNYSGRLKDQIIYDRPRQSWYVYTEDGIVTSIQHRPGVEPTRTVSMNCPTPMEIRAMETSASSIRLSEAERVERLKQIGEARKCGR
jgi:hypothetical protein